MGLAAGALGVYAASARYPAFRSLTLPLRAFLITSSGTFAGTHSSDATMTLHRLTHTSSHRHRRFVLPRLRSSAGRPKAVRG